MAKVMTLKVKVYTIAELKEANERGFEKAMERLLESEYEDSMFVNECLQDTLIEYAKERGYEVSRGRRGSSLEWDDDRGDYCVWDGALFLEVLLPRYFEAKKIPSSTRAMLLAMDKRGAFDTHVRLRSAYMRGIMQLEFDYVEAETDDTDPRTVLRHEAAAEAFREWLEEDLNDTAYEMLKLVKAEWEYHTSEAYLMENAEANERVFTIDGDSTVWVGSNPEEDENA